MVRVIRKQDNKKSQTLFFETKEQAIEEIKGNMEKLYLSIQKKCGWVDRETTSNGNVYTLTLSPMLMFYKPTTFTYEIKGE